MNIDYRIKINSLNSIYENIYTDKLDRQIDVEFSIPSKGINSDTGICTYISGYGSNMDSNVCKKIRRIIADEYNMICLQCNYFGSEFMQGVDNFNDTLIYNEDFSQEIKFNSIDDRDITLNDILEFSKKYNISNIHIIKYMVKENIHNFNDMGIMQAMDNIIALLNVINIILDNGYKLNLKRNILYGNSHGAYLCYLCNALLPNIYSTIIDNSAWCRPEYLGNGKRELIFEENGVTIGVMFEYKANEIVENMECIELKEIYSQFHNNCKIISYHGEDDELASLSEKIEFLKDINKSNLYIVGKDEVDMRVFKSSTHGLGADFIELFRKAIDEEEKVKSDINIDLIDFVRYKIGNRIIEIDYREILPKVTLL